MTTAAPATLVNLQLMSNLLTLYRSLDEEIDRLTANLDEVKAGMHELMDTEQVESTTVDDARLTIVGGYSSSLDKKKFVLLGGSLEILAAAVVKKPKKKYLKITIGEERAEKEGSADE